jgi:hypothetical protein
MLRYRLAPLSPEYGGEGSSITYAGLSKLLLNPSERTLGPVLAQSQGCLRTGNGGSEGRGQHFLRTTGCMIAWVRTLLVSCSSFVCLTLGVMEVWPAAEGLYGMVTRSSGESVVSGIPISFMG